MSFFDISLEQVIDEKRENIQNIAIATRGAKLEDFPKFLKQFDKKTEKDAQDNHNSNLALLSKKL